MDSLEACKSALLMSIEAEGGRKAWCERYGLGNGALGDVISGRIKPPPRVLAAIGWRRRWVYEPVENVSDSI